MSEEELTTDQVAWLQERATERRWQWAEHARLMTHPHFIYEIRQGKSGLEQWVIEISLVGRIEHGPMKSSFEANGLIARRKAELRKLDPEPQNFP